MAEAQRDGIEVSVADLIARVFRRQHRAYGRAIEPHGLTSLHAHVLLRLWFDGPMRMGTLQRRLALSGSTFTGAIDRMQKLGLVERQRHPEDGRAFLVVPAEWPRARRRKLERAIQDTEEEALAVLTAKERKTLHRLLEKVATHMEALES